MRAAPAVTRGWHRCWHRCWHQKEGRCPSRMLLHWHHPRSSPRGSGTASPLCDTELLSPPCALGWLGDSLALRARCPGVRALRRDRCHHRCRWHRRCSHVPSSSSSSSAADFPEPCQAPEGSGAHPGSQHPAPRLRDVPAWNAAPGPGSPALLHPPIAMRARPS